MKLVFMVTRRCNASCGHCSTSCGPSRSEALSRQDIFKVMDEAAALAEGGQLKFSITGGEPFLDLGLLRDVIAHGTALGADVSCVSNGYWATSPEKARTLLTDLKRAGLGLLAVSTSRFHQQFVKLQRVERALRAARDIGLPCALKFVRLRSDPDDADSMTAWGKAAGACRVEAFSVLPHLAEGVSLPEDEYIRDIGLPQGPCPAPVMTIAEDGEAYSCCTPGSIKPFYSLGNTRGAALFDLRNRFYLGGKQQLLRVQGPIQFARQVEARGEGHRLRSSYASVCDLCTHIASDGVMAAVAEDVARDFEMQQIESFLGPRAESKHVPRGGGVIPLEQGELI